MNAAQDALVTTVENGGGTFYADTLLPLELQRGYAVAYGGVTLDPAKVDAETLRQWARRVSQEWDASLVGTWLEGGVLYVDAVRIFSFDRFTQAVQFGVDNGQLAIYDFESGASIPLTFEEVTGA